MKKVNVSEGLKMKLQLLASENAEGGETQKDEHSENDSQASTNQNNQQERQEKTFTQAELDEIISKRIAKIKKQEDAKKQELEEAKKLESMSEQQRAAKRMQDLEAKLAKMEAEKAREALVNTTLKEMNTRGIDSEFLDFVLGEDADTTKEKLDTFQNKFNAMVEAKVEAQINERFKASGGVPKTGTLQKQSGFTKEDLNNMTPEQINANWEQISKMKFN